MQLINPAHFAGREVFLDEMQSLVDASHASQPVPGGATVRMPGERALWRRRQVDAGGLHLPLSLLDTLQPWLMKFGVDRPSASHHEVG